MTRFLLAVVLTLACGLRQTQDTQPAPTPAAADVITGYPAQVLAQVNKYRKDGGKRQLKDDSTLAKMAQDYAGAMAASGQLTHSLGGQDLGRRLKSAGVRYYSAGENIAAGQQTPNQVTTAWWNSPGHRANILRQDFTDSGVGVARDRKNRLWWCEVFDYPISLRGEPPVYTPRGLIQRN